jgi:hypothetical protein
MLDRRLHTNTARELWNDLSFIEKRIREQQEYKSSLSFFSGHSNILGLKFDASSVEYRFQKRKIVLEKIRDNDWQRASGQITCIKCGKEMNRHPNVEGYEWLTILCDGSLVKL